MARLMGMGMGMGVTSLDVWLGGWLSLALFHEPNVWLCSCIAWLVNPTLGFGLNEWIKLS